MTVTLRTKRLVLRPVKDEDCEALHAIYRDPVAMQYWSRLPHERLEETRQTIEDLKGRKSPIGFGLVIDYQGVAIGRVGFSHFPEIGFILSPNHWGQGFAIEAVSAMIQHSFVALDLEQVTADVDPRNNASITLLQKLGFKETGRARNTFLLGEEWCDSIYFSLSRAAFQQRLAV